MKIFYLILPLLLTTSACSSDDAICEDPTGGYTAFVQWGAGTCVVADGPITFTITDEDMLWRAIVPGWGAGTARTSELPSRECASFVEVVGVNELDELLTYSFYLEPDNGDILGQGSVQVSANDGSSCLHAFRLVDIVWKP